MIKLKYLLFPLLVGLSPAFNVSAQSVLISDSFARTGYLNGSTPNVTVNGANWIAFNNGTAATWKTSGSGVTADLSLIQTAGVDMGAGYFTSHPGVYTLSADFTLPANSASTAWLSLGFITTGSLSASSAGGNMAGSNGGWPFVIVRQNGDVKVGGSTLPGLSGPIILNSTSASGQIFTTGTPLTVSLVLNTALTHWTFDAYVGGVQLDLNGATAGNTYTFATTNPDIQYVGLSDGGTGTSGVMAGVNNFSLLYDVPEPSTGSLLSLTFIAIAVTSYRRRFALRS